LEILKQEDLKIISKIPDTADTYDIACRLYIIYKIRKGKEAVQRGEVLSIEDLRKEIDSMVTMVCAGKK
jgi:hypothetical protein